MILGIDHILVAVEDVERAAETYRRLGFQVERGGTHGRMGTYNALVPLGDGIYLELIGVKDRELAAQFPHTRRVLDALARPNRAALYALDTDDLGAQLDAARGRGLAIGDPAEGERMRPDGQRVAWRSAHPVDEQLPFLIEDVTPRALRIPPPVAGVGRWLRVRQLRQSATDEGAYVEKLRQLTGRAPMGGLFALSRGRLQVVRGARTEVALIELLVDDMNRVADVWNHSGVEFQEESLGSIGQQLIPGETAGAPLAVVGR